MFGLLWKVACRFTVTICASEKKLGFPLEYLAISFYVTNKIKSKESERIEEKKTAGKKIWMWSICEVKWSWTGSIRCTKIENIMQFIWLYLCAACELNLIVECAVFTARHIIAIHSHQKLARLQTSIKWASKTSIQKQEPLELLLFFHFIGFYSIFSWYKYSCEAG